jgi:hypothetical protein
LGVGTYNGAACLRDEDEAQPEVARIERMQVVAELAGAGFLSFFIDTVRIVDASARVCGGIVVCHFRLSLSFVRIEEARQLNPATGIPTSYQV